MKITTSRILLSCLGIIILSNGENVRGSLEQGNQRRLQQSNFSARVKENRTLARNAEKLSKVALDRYRNNCILVRDGRSTKEDYFKEGILVMNTKATSTMRPGAFVCNRLGDTAVVGIDGKMEDIARVTTADQEEFKSLLQQR